MLDVEDFLEVLRCHWVTIRKRLSHIVCTVASPLQTFRLQGCRDPNPAVYLSPKGAGFTVPWYSAFGTT